MTEEGGAPQAPDEQEFRVGDKVYRLTPFKGSKGVRAFAIISRIGNRFEEVWKRYAEFERQFRELNTMTITRDLARYRVVQAQNVIARLEVDAAELAPERVAEKRAKYQEELNAIPWANTPEGDPLPEDPHAGRRSQLEGMLKDLDDAPAVLDGIPAAIRGQEAARDEWQRTLEYALADQEEMVVPRQPSMEQRFLAMFPQVWGLAEDEVTMLLGLVLIPDEDLKAARATPEGADGAMMRLGEQLLDELEIDLVAELVVTAVDYGLQRYRPRVARLEGRVSRIQEILTPSLSSGQPENGKSDGEYGPDRRNTEKLVGTVEREEEPELWTPTPETSPGPSSNSSTDSPPPTDGPSTESSSESSGRTSSPSPS